MTFLFCALSYYNYMLIFYTFIHDRLWKWRNKEGLWAFLQDIVHITLRIHKSYYIGRVSVNEKGHFQKVNLHKDQMSGVYWILQCDVSVFWHSKLLIDLGTDIKHLHGSKFSIIIFPCDEPSRHSFVHPTH